MNSEELAKEILAAAQDVKAEDPVVLDLRTLTSFTDFFVIVSGRSDRQVQAIADRVTEDLREKKIKPMGIEGYDSGHWVLIDYGAVVLHVFYGETREFYLLEQLWSDAPRLEVNSDDQKAAP